MSDIEEVNLPVQTMKSKPIKLVRSWDKRRLSADTDQSKDTFLISPPRSVTVNDPSIQNDAAVGSEADRQAAMMASVDEDTSRVVDELFRDFLAQKMELIETEHRAKVNTEVSMETTNEQPGVKLPAPAVSRLHQTMVNASESQMPDSSMHAAASHHGHMQKLVKETLPVQKEIVENREPSAVMNTTSLVIKTENDNNKFRNHSKAVLEKSKHDITQPSILVENSKHGKPSQDSKPQYEGRLLPPLNRHKNEDDSDVFAETKLNAGKKPVVKLGMLGIKISQTSAQLISSGVKADEKIKKKDFDEGECTPETDDEDNDSSEDGDSEDDSDDEIDDSETGSISDDAEDKTSDATSKPKKRKKKKVPTATLR